MIELETMTLADLKVLAEITEKIRRERLNNELTKRVEKIQTLLDECFDLIEESGLNVHANTANGYYTDKVDFAEILVFELEDEE